jgi:type III secretory pathway component EscS
VVVGGNPTTDAFGVIIFVSMTPVLVVQMLGLLFARTQAKMQKAKEEATP